MKRDKRSKVIRVVSVLLCFIMATTSFTVTQGYAANGTVDSIDILAKYGVLLGETIQLKAVIEPENAWFLGVEWSSSDPEVISCTEDGLIKGLKAGESVVITCKAKIGSAKDKITVYCVEKFASYTTTNMKDYFTFIYSKPNTTSIADVHCNIIKIFPVFKRAIEAMLRIYLDLGVLSAVPMSSVCLGNVRVYGKISNYAYIRYNVNGESYSDGFVKHNALEKTLSGFLYLSAKDINVWANGKAYEQKKLTSDYKKPVRWEVADGDDTIDFDDETGQIIGINPGTTTITARADGMEDVCYVHCLYQWKQTWTTKTNKNTYLYAAVGEGYKTIKAMDKGTDFVVHGDTGASDGWAFGKIKGTNTWGYVSISDVSTKGTVSQYSSLGWTWPVRDVKNNANQTTKARYISSPYGWRDTNPAQHKGIDITNGISSNENLSKSIDGYEVVSAFAGMVIYVYDISSGYKSCGNCVAIRSNEKDPITGKYYVAIYMHLKSKPSVRENQNISANTLLGYVGDTGNSGGSHLHFEVNNQNLSYGQKIYYENDSDKEMIFGSVINPLFFYMSYYNLPESDSGKIRINPTCDAMDYRGPLWYGDDIKESKEP